MARTEKIVVDGKHIEMMAAVIAAGMLNHPDFSVTNETDIARYSLLMAREIVRQNREPKP